MAAAAQSQCARQLVGGRQAAPPAAAAAARPTPSRSLPARRAGPRSAVVAASAGFHQSLLVASERPAGLVPLAGPLEVRRDAAWVQAGACKGALPHTALLSICGCE